MVTIFLSCTVSEIQQHIGQNRSHLFGAPVGGDTVGISRRFLASVN